MTKTAAIDVQAEVGQIMDLTMPYIVVADILSRDWFGQYDLKGTVSAAEHCGTPAEARLHLLARADELVAALAAEGWQIMDHLDMNLVTEVENFKQTLHGEMVIPSHQHSVALKVEMRIGRAR